MSRARRTAAVAFALLAAVALPAAAQEQSFAFHTPISADAIFSAINGERSGYIEAELIASEMVYVENGDPNFKASGFFGDVLLKGNAIFRVSFNEKIETVDGKGKKQSKKMLRILRAGPGEQITLGFRRYSATTPAIEVALLYYDDSANLIGRTQPMRFYVNDNNPTSTVTTFTRADLR